jgi:hypothetical protein
MFKRLVLLFVVMAALMFSAGPARALQTAAVIYVDTAYTGTETGSQTQPFNTQAEAIAYAQSQPYGGNIYTKQATGAYTFTMYVAPVYPPDSGTALSGSALLALLAVLSLILVLAGWFLLRRSRANPHAA